MNENIIVNSISSEIGSNEAKLDKPINSDFDPSISIEPKEFNYLQPDNKDYGIKEGYLRFVKECPLCKEFNYVYTKDEEVRYSQLEEYLNNTSIQVKEPCFKCWVKLNNWIKEHKFFCDKKKLSYYDIANALLKKKGEETRIGFDTIEVEEEGKTDINSL